MVEPTPTVGNTSSLHSYGLTSKQFDKTVTEISYLVSIYVLVLGTGPMIWNPFAQTLGRRPVVCFNLRESWEGLLSS